MTGTNRTVLWIIFVVLAVVLLLWALKIIDFSAQGGEVPEVRVQGGELPTVDADVADVDVGSENVVVQVPTVDADAADAEAAPAN